MEAHGLRIVEDRKQWRWVVWHIAAFQRVPTLPTLDEVMGQLPEAQSDEVIEAKIEGWVKRHNARLKPEECRYEVAQLVEE